MSAINEHLRRTLEREHEATLKSELAARTFRQYRLNILAIPVDQQPLITSSEWQRVVERQVPACEGSPVIRDRSRRYEVLVSGMCRLAVWSNHGMGFSTWSSESV